MRYFLVHVFTGDGYVGNPLAVFVSEPDLDAARMQEIARRLQLSETTFITSRTSPFAVRIFTPDMEVPFAGHPTLGTAFVIREVLGWERSDRVTLQLGVGEIPVDFADGVLTMTQKQPHFDAPIDDRARIARILGINEGDLDAQFPVQCVSTGLPSVIVPLASMDAIARCRIDHDEYARFLADTTKAAILVMTRHADLRVRVFVDDTGFFEDPATGSANGNLAAYVAEHRYFGEEHASYTVEQGVEMESPSLLRVSVAKERGVFTIRVGGRVERKDEFRIQNSEF